MTPRSRSSPLRLHVTESGPLAAPPLVLLHGLGASSETWDGVLGELASSHRARAVDLRGHGRSPRSTHADYRLDDYARDVIELLNHDDRPAVLVGHSLGAAVALTVAERTPDRVRALVLVDPPLFGADRPPGEPRPAIDRFLQMRDAIRSGTADPADPDAEVFTPVIADRGVRGCATSVPAACPALVIRADAVRGPAFTAEDARRLRKASPHIEVVEAVGAGHYVHADDPQMFTGTVRRFLAALN